MAHLTTGIYGDNKKFSLNIFGNLTLDIINYIFMGQGNPRIKRNELKQLTIGTNVTSIGCNAFDDCYNLTGNLIIPNSVVKIDNFAFKNCGNLTGNLTIPNSVSEIGLKAFYFCSGLRGKLTIPDSVVKIGNAAFGHCSGLEEDTYTSDDDSSYVPDYDELSESDANDIPEENKLQRRTTRSQILWRNLSQTDEPEPATINDDETSVSDVSDYMPKPKKIPVPTRYKNFCTIKNETLKKAVPDIHERESEISRMWSKLTKTEKNKYKTGNNPFAVKEKIVEIKEFVPTQTQYGNFFNAKKELLKNSIPNMKERMIEIKRMWRGLSKTEKDKYKPVSSDTDNSDDEPEQKTTNDTDDSDSSDNLDYSGDSSDDDDETCYNNTVSNVRINIKKSKHISIVFN